MKQLIRLLGIEIRYDADPEKELLREVQKRLGRCASSMIEYRVSRRSIDARRRPVRLIYSVDVLFKEGEDLSSIKDAREAPKKEPLRTTPGTTPLSSPPVVVGAGPSGLFAALFLAEHGYRPLLIDRGGDTAARVEALRAFSSTRTPDPECNALFGLGGAGTFSDGKLATGVNHPWLKSVLDILAECGAPSQITFDAKPHVGTDVLREVVTKLAARIERAGGEIRMGVRMDGVRLRRGRLCGLDTTMGEVDCETAILAVGHSARDTWMRLREAGVALEPKPFQLGIRAEHPQGWLDALRYREAAGHSALGAADYKLATKVDGVPVFSFCMCPGGETMPTVNEPFHLAINGMSESGRASPFSSSGLVVTLTPKMYGGVDLDSCLTFQRGVEAACFQAGGNDYAAPAQRLVDFKNGVLSKTLPPSSFRLGVRAADLAEVLPEMVALPLRRALAAFDRTLPGYLQQDALALAPESRASSPIRIVRDPVTLDSPNAKGLYPAGEGAGFAGGIMSSALDGLNAARKIVETYRPPGG